MLRQRHSWQFIVIQLSVFVFSLALAAGVSWIKRTAAYCVVAGSCSAASAPDAVSVTCMEHHWALCCCDSPYQCCGLGSMQLL
jgi:hypothetical protein